MNWRKIMRRAGAVACWTGVGAIGLVLTIGPMIERHGWSADTLKMAGVVLLAAVVTIVIFGGLIIAAVELWGD